MARVSFSHLHSNINEIKSYYNYSKKALQLFFTENHSEFTGFTIDELNTLHNHQQKTLNRSCTLKILIFLEARFKIDYIIRSQEKKRDSLSRKFRKSHKTFGSKAPLDSIISIIKEDQPKLKNLLDNFNDHIKHRNWLAHGRYLEPKISLSSTKYDYINTLILAENIIQNIDLLEPKVS